MSPNEAPPEDEPETRHPTVVMWALLVCAFLAMLDGSVIVTILPKIVDQVGGSDSWYLWLVTAYLLASSISVPIYGRFSDLYGRRRLLLLGLGLFLVGSLACGFAGSMAFLIAARTVQGLGAGALLTLSMAAIREVFPTGKSTVLLRIQSIIAALMLIGMVGGPLLGGVLADGIGWRWAFFINLPFAGAAFVALTLLYPRIRQARTVTGRLDVAGIALLSTGLSLVLIGLSLKGQSTGGRTLEWTDPVVAGCLVLGALLLAALVPVERRAGTPILPLYLLRGRSFSALLVGGFFFQLAVMPIGIIVPLYFQHVRGYSASTSAFLVLPLLVGMALSSRLTALVILGTGRTKPVLLAGAALLTTGSAAFAFLDGGTSPWLTSVWLLLAGVGTGPAMGGLTIATQNSVPRSDMGTGTAGATLTKQLGGVLGLTLAQSLANHYTHNSAINTEAASSTILWISGTAGLLAVASIAMMHDVFVERPGKPLPGTPAAAATPTAPEAASAPIGSAEK
ncbi:drug resistance transporter, EmrB/QacA subfamily [Actinokineospora spheciospongiae]|uniref:Drug resistance transporter, EmrB/QacA subfamily n=1 Tax=Actinokineospora spheciospongiae TaxID=909613 RepID=W7J2P9_9PSEU|nr:MFS transporter [Actinokineospora spheciospongiae]EWC63342.1 drug resistance transporter, EmrB/QacA subfamily [Actinokineospora spheciospongiae]